MKRKGVIALIVLMLCVMLVACNQATKEISDTTQADIKALDVRFDENGVAFNLPEKWRALEGRNIDIYTALPEENVVGQIVISHILDETIDKANKINLEADKIPETDKAAIQKAVEELQQLLEEFKEMCRIVTIDKRIEKGNAQNELFAKYEVRDLIGEADNLEFYLLYNNKPDTDALTEISKKAHEEFLHEIKSFKGLIQVYKPITVTEKVSENKLVFKTKTLDSKEIDSSILKDSKLTMINIWATFCQPCIEEMPDLQSLYEEVKGDGVNIIGIVSDTPDEETEELAKKILSTKGVKYINIIPDESIINNVLRNISAVPTTLFVDSEGNIIGDLLVGAKSKEEYQQEIQDRLKSKGY